MSVRTQGNTAMARSEASRPIRIAVEHGVVRADRSFLDYGCGRGGDVEWLAASGWRARGWDPVHRPKTRLTKADTVGLTYVLNVIEDLRERRQALARAWELTTSVLVVSARLNDERDQAHTRPRSDGWVSNRGTFQKFFDHIELGGFIEGVTGVEPVPAAPGVYYVFRQTFEREAFVSRRYALRAPAPYQRKSDRDFMQHRAMLEPLIEFFARHGRVPRSDELENGADIVSAFGSMARAFRVVEVVTNREEWIALSGRRRVDLLVYLALKMLDGPYRMSELAPTTQQDVRAHFSSLKSATAKARQLLFGVGSLRNIDLACRSSTVGKLTPTALYVHVDAYEFLPAILKVYEGCARRLMGESESANLVKLFRSEKRVSYLSYPEFDTVAHPALAMSETIDLESFGYRRMRYDKARNKPILHRKELFIAKSDPRWQQFADFTSRETELGLLERCEEVGFEAQWNARLLGRGYVIVDHEVSSSAANYLKS